jgi:CubicO group peptidase (beta-lactamase class C family)
MGILGPFLPLLEVDVDVQLPGARARLLGSESLAMFHGSHGCALNPTTTELDHVQQQSPAPVAVADLPRQLLPALEPVVDRAFEEPLDGVRNTLAVVVLRNGVVAAERYAPLVTRRTPLQGWSMNKSLTATWVGVQVERGNLDLELPVAAELAAYDPALAENVPPALTLSHLLHMESGFDFEETYLPGDDATRMLYRSDAAWQVAPSVGQAAEPGQRFSYSSGDTNLAAWLWQSSLGVDDYAPWLQHNIYRPLGINSAISEHDPSGIQVGSSYTYMTAGDWARMGQFWLDAWHGRGDLLSQSWQQAATRPRPSANKGEYGRGFWLNAQGHDFPDLPRNMFYASGHNSQYVAVFPEQEVVVVRLGLSSGNASSGIQELLSGVLAALE